MPDDDALATRATVRAALYARVVTLFEGALLLIRHERELDFRIHSRSVLEAAMHVVALNSDDGYVERLREDDRKARHALANLQLASFGNGNGTEQRRAIEQFLRTARKGRRLDPSNLLGADDFPALYRAYRMMCFDAVHVGVASLDRHFVEDASGTTRLAIRPGIGDDDLHDTFSQLGVSLMISTLMIRARPSTAVGERLLEHFSMLRALAAATRPAIGAAPTDLGCSDEAVREWPAPVRWPGSNLMHGGLVGHG